MKTINFKYAVAALLLMGLWACTDDGVDQRAGKLPDKEPLENTYGLLCSSRATEREVDILLTQGSGFMTDNIYYQITKPIPTNLSLGIRVDEDAKTLEAFNAIRETEHKTQNPIEEYVPFVLLPVANYELPDGKTLDVAQDGKRSASKRVKVLAKDLTPGYYLLPITVSGVEQKGVKQTLYYTITIRQPKLGDHKLHNGDDLFFVFYINTALYQPLLADDYFMQKKPRRGSGEIWYNTIGNIINLRTVTLNFDTTTKRAMLNQGKDMTHVLNHVVKYIRPLQDKGRKVCISIEGGGTGLGFCNMTDSQIADFVAQVKAVVETYDLDGINLWDRNAGYGKEGMSAMNTTSYPKLIKALREALGSEKLLTVTVYDKPTETFYDTAASGGIAVGDYIDYAWSGYNSEQEAPQLLDPWHPDWQHTDLITYPYGRVSAYTQKPIANLDPSKFGCINFPLYGSMDDPSITSQSFIGAWAIAGHKPNKIVVFSDLRTILQDRYETIWNQHLEISCQVLADDGPYSSLPSSQQKTYQFDVNILGKLPSGASGYGKWLKDW